MMNIDANLQEMIEKYSKQFPGILQFAEASTRKVNERNKFFLLITYRYSDDRLCYQTCTRTRAIELIKEIVDYNEEEVNDLFWFSCGSANQDCVAISLHDILSIEVVSENPLERY